MNRRVLKIVGLLAGLVLVFLVGAAAGGGAVFAATKVRTPDNEPLAALQAVDSEPGTVIAAVTPDSPAAQAGLRRGDILLKIDDTAVNHVEELVRYLSDRESGVQVELSVLHGDEQRTLTATLGERDGQPYLGILPCGGLFSKPAAIALAIPGPGARIIEVAPDSPAQEAGLQVGDLITAVDGQALDAEKDLAAMVAQHAPGDSLTLEVTSPGKESRQVTVRLGKHPENQDAAYLGVRYVPTPRIDRSEGRLLPFGRLPFEGDLVFPFPDGVEQGAVVSRVAEDSPAAAAGLRQGDIITAIDGAALAGQRDLADAVAEHQPGDVLKLEVYRPETQETLDLQVTLTEHPDQEGIAYLGVQAAGFFQMRRFEGGGPLPLPGLKPLQRRFKIEVPFNAPSFHLETEPGWLEWHSLPDSCCDGDLATTI